MIHEHNDPTKVFEQRDLEIIIEKIADDYKQAQQRDKDAGKPGKLFFHGVMVIGDMTTKSGEIKKLFLEFTCTPFCVMKKQFGLKVEFVRPLILDELNDEALDRLNEFNRKRKEALEEA